MLLKIKEANYDDTPTPRHDDAYIYINYLVILIFMDVKNCTNNNNNLKLNRN